MLFLFNWYLFFKEHHQNETNHLLLFGLYFLIKKISGVLYSNIVAIYVTSTESNSLLHLDYGNELHVFEIINIEIMIIVNIVNKHYSYICVAYESIPGNRHRWDWHVYNAIRGYLSLSREDPMFFLFLHVIFNEWL